MNHKFTIRRAVAEDVDAIVSLMETVKTGMTRPDWYVIDDRDWIELHIERCGISVVAEADDGKLAGYFIVDFPAVRLKGSDGVVVDNLGEELKLSDEELCLVAHMDSAAVHPDYRGNHLQDLMLKTIETELQNRPEQHLLSTVHPENHASLNTMLRNGYVIINTKEKYGGLSRHILYKKKEKARPKILVSACLLGINCRYNGKGELNEELVQLMKDADLIPVCPETIGGLPTPRNPAERKGAYVLTQAGADVTAEYQKGAEVSLHLATLYECRCAIMKERSPSCGQGQIYDGTHTRTLTDGDGTAVELLKKHGIFVFGESEIESCRFYLGI